MKQTLLCKEVVIKNKVKFKIHWNKEKNEKKRNKEDNKKWKKKLRKITVNEKRDRIMLYTKSKFNVLLGICYIYKAEIKWKENK